LTEENAICNHLEILRAAVVPKNVTQEVLCIVTVLLSHQIDDIDKLSGNGIPVFKEN
jgi:hypothetical protein